MNARQRSLLEYHRDIAEFSTNAKTPVFVILDLDDPVAFEIASTMQANCADKLVSEGRCVCGFVTKI